MAGVQPKKHLGQHFLTDERTARRIVDAFPHNECNNILEIGPGTGVLTKYLKELPGVNLWAMEVDEESVTYLEATYPSLSGKILLEDFLKYPVDKIFPKQAFGVIGNFPYNISSQIFFQVLANRDRIPMVVGMIQKEVADRLCEQEGSKTYGILSVLLQTFYEVKYLFTVKPGVFLPPPKVKSAVIRLERNHRKSLPCNEAFFFRVVKMAFNQRRKTLRNALKSILLPLKPDWDELGLRAEQLSVEQFIALVCKIEEAQNEISNE